METQEKVKTWGGARRKAGRKPVADKLIPLTIYVRQSEIIKAEGQDNARGILKSLWQSQIVNAANRG